MVAPRRKQQDPAEWYRLSVYLSAKLATTANEEFAVLLWELGASGIVTDDTLDHAFSNIPLGQTLIQAYFELTQPLPQQHALNNSIRDFFARQGPHPDFMPVNCSWEKIDTRQTDVSWKQFHPTILVGQRFRITPPWDNAPHDGRITMVLDPSMAFGTGQHATTQLILQFLEDYPVSPSWKILDCGTGSGILALAAHYLGCRSVCAFDHDPLVSTVLKENIRLNSASASIQPFIGTLDCLKSHTFDLVLANLEWEIIQTLGPAIFSHIKPNGICVFSGLLITEKPAFTTLLNSKGFRAFWEKNEAGWVALAIK